MKEYKYLSFVELKPKPKTKVFEVRSKSSNGLLGFVQWYAQWRKYCFLTASGTVWGTVFDVDCLGDIQDFIDGLMAERKGKSK